MGPVKTKIMEMKSKAPPPKKKPQPPNHPPTEAQRLARLALETLYVVNEHGHNNYMSLSIIGGLLFEGDVNHLLKNGYTHVGDHEL